MTCSHAGYDGILDADESHHGMAHRAKSRQSVRRAESGLSCRNASFVQDAQGPSDPAPFQPELGVAVDYNQDGRMDVLLSLTFMEPKQPYRAAIESRRQYSEEV
ncbi:MAG: hypothetical protein IPM54_10170 [Polyangiaceae bacterium]|nr:hypothetical protein [Polyangiaceae bacterium]